MEGEISAFCALELLSHDINLIDAIVAENSKKTHDIFQTQIYAMKSIREDIKSVKSDLSDLQDGTLSPEIKKLEEITNLTHSILERTDKVIKKFQGFVTILQSQDKIEQMLQGSAKIAKSSMETLGEENFPEGKRSKIKLELSKKYTIKEQRDFAIGEITLENKEKITLF